MWLTCPLHTAAQLADGAIAPDFSFTDISGGTCHLYDYLSEGKIVAIDISATWCSPCWIYHNAGVMDSLYSAHDAAGDNTWRVLFIEGDGNTTLADLNGTGTNTQGDWLTGTDFRVCNPSGIPLNDFRFAWDVSVFPTLYVVCPDKRVYQDTLNGLYKPGLATWEHVGATSCTVSAVGAYPLSGNLRITPNPATGSFRVVLPAGYNASVQYTVSDMLGRRLIAGATERNDQPGISIDLHDTPPGVYLVDLTLGDAHWQQKLSVY